MSMKYFKLSDILLQIHSVVCVFFTEKEADCSKTDIDFSDNDQVFRVLFKIILPVCFL